MNDVVSRAQALKERVIALQQGIFDEQIPLEEYADAILDFKTLSYKTDANAPIHQSIMRLTAGDAFSQEKKVVRLLDKFIEYNSED